MTELFIDGVEVVLPEDLNLSVKRENVKFTKNGEYTYDLTLSLENPVNAKLYEHLNRFNTTAKVKTKRSAVLIADNRVYCRGSEIIDSWTDRSVTIQIASGNSELNYFIGGDLMIEYLEMGSADFSEPLQYIEKFYPEVDFCLCPVVMETNGELMNDWKIQSLTKSTGSILEGTFRIIPDVKGITALPSTFYAQPYLCFYLKKLIEALGYEVTYNQLEGSEWETLFILQNGHKTKFAKMFPGWSVSDFLLEVEKLFNLIFVIDNDSRCVRIMFNNTFYIGSDEVTVRDIVDAYEGEPEDDQVEHTQSNISFNVPDNAYFKIQNLSESFLESALIMDFDTRNEMEIYFSEHGYNAVKNILFRLTTNNTYFVATNITGNNFQRVNLFGSLTRPNATGDIELNMIPATMKRNPIKSINSDTELGVACYDVEQEYTLADLPVLAGEMVSQEENFSLYELLTNEEAVISKPTSHRTLSLLFYQGMSDLYVVLKIIFNKKGSGLSDPENPYFVKYPAPFNFNDFGKLKRGDFRLCHLDELLYTGVYSIDMSKAIQVKSYDPNVYDTRLIFNIRNKRYVCKEMEFNFDKRGRKGAWTGTFYPIAISDTEAHKKWILTDGKWRDGGVWIDNGRWLDK